MDGPCLFVGMLKAVYCLCENGDRIVNTHLSEVHVFCSAEILSEELETISLEIVTKFRLLCQDNISELINFYSPPWNHQKAIGFLMILRGDRSQIILLNWPNISSKIWQWFLSRVFFSLRSYEMLHGNLWFNKFE